MPKAHPPAPGAALRARHKAKDKFHRWKYMVLCELELLRSENARLASRCIALEHIMDRGSWR